MCVCYRAQFIKSVSPLTVIWLKAIAWEWLTKRHVQPNISRVFYVRVCVCVQGQRLDDYFCAIIFLLQKKVSTILIYTNQWCTGKCRGIGGGGRYSRPTCLPKQTQSLRALCASLILSHSQHRRKLIITFLPVNSEVADMKSDVLLRELKWEVYSSIICHCLSRTQGCRKANICQLNWAQKKQHWETNTHMHPH